MIGHGTPMGVSFQGNFDLKINPSMKTMSMSRHDKNIVELQFCSYSPAPGLI